jgi:HAE1 family hydrophobic/amphiphilic exporter-1
LVVALTLVPLMASRFLRMSENIDEKSFLKRIANRIGNWIKRLQGVYVSSLDWALQHRKTILFSTLGILVLSIGLLMTRGGEFFPESDQGLVQMALDRSPGTSLAAMEKSAHTLNQIIQEHIPEAEMVYTNIGQGEGMFAAFSSSASNQGECMIRLKPRSQRKRSMEQIQDDLRERFKTLPDMEVRFEDRGQQMFMGGADIVVEIFGHDLDVAGALANEVVKRISSVRGVANVEVSIEEAAPELKIQLDRQRIADLGLSTSQVGQVVSTGVLGSVVTRYREGGDEYDVRVQLRKDARENTADLENILVMTPMGQQVPLRAIARIERGMAPTEILREDQERKVSVTIDVSGRDLRTTTNDVRKALRGMIIPNDFRIEIGGAAQDMMESFMYLGIAFFVAMILTYMVMASQFESLIDPFIILFTIPLSIIGVAWGLFFTGTTLSVMALIGIIMLVGIIVNNGIVLVDYTNQLRGRGHELFEAIHLAGEARMRPVLMTALTTIFAMLPLALGLGESGENWAPMARSVIGGLTAGTVLTLVVIPVIYAVLEIYGGKRKEKRAARKERRRQKKMGLAKVKS